LYSFYSFSGDPILKNPITKNCTGGVSQVEDPEFKPQYCKKKKKITTSINSTFAYIAKRIGSELGSKVRVPVFQA
jgi:hypothetical protein